MVTGVWQFLPSSTASWCGRSVRSIQWAPRTRRIAPKTASSSAQRFIAFGPRNSCDWLHAALTARSAMARARVIELKLRLFLREEIGGAVDWDKSFRKVS